MAKSRARYLPACRQKPAPLHFHEKYVCCAFYLDGGLQFFKGNRSLCGRFGFSRGRRGSDAHIKYVDYRMRAMRRRKPAKHYVI